MAKAQLDVRIVGTDLPGRDWCDPRSDGLQYENVHVGVQRRQDVVDWFPSDASIAVWELTIDTVPKDGAIDFRGPSVHGKPGDRFLYLSWGTVDDDGNFEMFRRAKLMLDAVDDKIVRAAQRAGNRLVGTLALTGGDGGPRCAAVRPPQIEWTAESA
jgi:Family of unknown function (DUF5990)